jgi:hypothetical protein
VIRILESKDRPVYVPQVARREVAAVDERERDFLSVFLEERPQVRLVLRDGSELVSRTSPSRTNIVIMVSLGCASNDITPPALRLA